jgi:23S rRNA (adenine2030-N6)-methyltransferase
MNYRHAYHAGNFADVLKHAVLAHLLLYLRRKDKAFFVLDTHAGAGRYDLDSDAARRTGEAAGGIGRLLAEAAPPAALGSYLEAVRAFNGGPAAPVRWYPGSPSLIRALMRPIDRLIAVEKHPEEVAALRGTFRGDKAVKVIELDGYLAFKAFLPPPERRGLVLVDPPFEEPGEFSRLADGLIAAHRRFASGLFVLWYPIKDPAESARFHGLLAARGLKRVLLVELLVRAPDSLTLLNGCGLVLVNPPHTLEAELAPLLPALARLLAQGSGASARLDWLVGE